MKRWIAAMLMLLLLMQALPLEALAASGHVLTDEELAAAYALTGFGETATARNSALHKGMTPNETWNAMQVSDWLDDKLSVEMFSIEEILTKLSNMIVNLKQIDPDAYARYVGDKEPYRNYGIYVEHAQQMYVDVEELREQMRWQQDRIEEQAGLIAELGAQLKQSSALYPSDKLRLSAQITAATAELKSARKEVAANAEQWQLKIDEWQDRLAFNDGGGSGEEYPGTGPYLASWIGELMGYTGEAETNTAKVTLVNASGSRIARLSPNGSVLSNADNATVHVMTENEIGLLFYTSDGNGGKKDLEGLSVRVKDTRNPRAQEATYTTDDRGRVFIPTNIFTADSDKVVHFKLDVEAEDQGCRSMGIAEVQMKLGEVRTLPMIPLSGIQSNAAVVSNDNGPYVYSMSFEGNDIKTDDYEMMYSSLNDWEFEIQVEVRDPNGGTPPAPKLSYWAKGSSRWKYEQKWAEPTSHEGNVYTFRNTWKRILAPEVDDEQRPFIAFSKEDSAEHFTTRLISLKSVVESPVEEGSDAFEEVLSDGLGFSFHIPVVEADVDLNLPFKQYLPKFQVDIAGFVTMSIGSDLFAEKLDDKVNWQSSDMKEYKFAQELREKEGWFANYKAMYATAYDEYTERAWKFMGESKLEIGLFALISARWEIDNEAEDITKTLLKGRGSAGFLLKYSYSWTIVHPVGPVPVYITFTLGVNAGFALGLQVGFSWDSNGFHDWELKPLKDITVNIAFMFRAQVGVGVKGFLELWARFTATLNFRLTLVIMGNEPSSFVIEGNVELEVGLTVFWVEFSKSWGPWGGTLYDSTAASNALPPLQKYVYENAQAPEEIVPATQEPARYGQLAPDATAILTEESDAHSTIRAATSNGHTFAFYLDQSADTYNGKRHQRVCWIDIDTGKKGDTQLELKYNDKKVHGSVECDEYAFDVWSDGKTILLLVCCATEFEEDGYPKTGTLINGYSYIYVMTLRYIPKGSSLFDGGDCLASYSDDTDYYPVEARAVHLDFDLNPRGLTNPRIEWAKVTHADDGSIESVEMYGFAERIEDKDGNTGFACIQYTDIADLRLVSDLAVKNSLGEDHERVNLRASVRGRGKTGSDWQAYFRCHSFLALSKPKDGVEGESAIELYDWSMNSAPITYEIIKKPTPGVLLKDTTRQAVAVKKGDIGGFEMVQTVGNGSDDYSQTVFYTQAETDGDGAKAYKLNGLHIGSRQSSSSGDLSFEVTDSAYDVTMPTSEFKVATVNGTPYVYWLATVEKEKASDPDTWQLWATVYDASTNTMSTPAVYSEFTLPSGIVPRDLLLTTTGQGYLTATPMPKDGDTKPQPMTLYSFPLTLKPVLTLQGMIVEDATVAAGDFEDTTITLMNEGNMGISAFDVQMYTRENGKTQVVETLHCDCLHPENSSLTMQGGNRSVSISDARQAIYRNSDFGYSPRQRSWVLGEEKLTLKLTQSNSKEAWKSSLTSRDSDTQYVQTNMMMPGALASFTGALKIPDNWSGDKTLYLRVSKVSAYANWQGAMANAAGVANRTGIAPNAAATQELTWALNEAGDKLELQTEGLSSNAAFVNAVKSGLIAPTVNAQKDLSLLSSVQDVEVNHRLYSDCDGTDLLDIIITNYADTKDSFKLTCAVYVDGSDTANYINLPSRTGAVASRTTQTVTMPVSALVDDVDAHSRARVVVSAVGRDENAYVNNEFTVYLGGKNALRFVRQPEDTTVQEGGRAAFEVEVSGGRGEYTYKWQVYNPETGKWVKLKCFDGPVLAREKVEKKWNGATFRCVVTDEAGTKIISESATLTVRDRVDTGDDTNLPLYLTIALAALALLWLLRRRMGADRA